jgi:hypothetical protein
MVVVAFMAATVIEPGDDDVHTEPDQVCGKRGQPFPLGVGEAVLDDDILANAVAEAPQAFFDVNDIERVLPEPDREEPHPIGPPCRLLRTRGQRQRDCRATKKRDELAPLHVSPKNTPRPEPKA